MYRIGIDVGGTNIDAVLLDHKLQPVAKAKHPTTADISQGMVQILRQLFTQCDVPREQIAYAMLGTTQCTNAIVERKKLNLVAAIRLGLPATSAIAPMADWPSDLQQALQPWRFMVGGGHEFDGREISPLDRQRLQAIAHEVKGNVESIAITGAFSPVMGDHEQQAAEIMRDILGDIPITLSQHIGSVGLLERENATILNAALISVAERTIASFVHALQQEGIHQAQVYITQNDGTLMDQSYACRYPIFTIACGPTNSIRGAAFLSGYQDALVVDVGGTTTDIGVLLNGFPRESSVAVEIGGVRTNFRMPDLVSIGLGGGSIIREVQDGRYSIGPDSVGYRLSDEALIFGGSTLTASDIAVASGRANFGHPQHLHGRLPAGAVDTLYQQMTRMVEEAIDRIKTQDADMPIVIVGGGSVLLSDQLRGASEVIYPPHYEVANAMGSAIAQVSGQVERIFSLETRKREEALEEAQQIAINEAINAGADPATITIVDIEDVPLAYLPSNATRIRVKAAGDLLKK